MNPSIPLHTHFLSPASLLALPLREVSIFPPETTIRTLSLKSQPISQINLILSHGAGILHTGSILIRSGDYADFILDSWNDPLVRSYGFPGNDHQALEHLIQWHRTILEGLAVMPKRSLLSFGMAAGDDEQFHEGDFVVHLDGSSPSSNRLINRCEQEGRSCEKEFLRYWAQRGSVTEENEQVLPQPNKLPAKS
jgi:mannan polymerase II complex MNN11 subunit